MKKSKIVDRVEEIKMAIPKLQEKKEKPFTAPLRSSAARGIGKLPFRKRSYPG